MHKRKGFTLIELLVVISVVVLLMALLLPALQRTRNQARAVVCQAHLKQWGTVLALYAEDNEGWIPAESAWRDLYWFFRGSWMQKGDPSRPKVYHDLNTKGIACCPMAVKVRPDTEFQRNFGYMTIRDGARTLTYHGGSTFGAWEIMNPPPRFHGSYGFNSTSTQGSNHWNLSGKVETHFAKGRANIPVILDSTSWTGRHRNNEPPPKQEFLLSWDFCINRHNGYINCLFLDWSVRRVGLKELWTLKWDEEADTAGPWTRAGGVRPEDWPKWMRRFKDY